MNSVAFIFGVYLYIFYLCRIFSVCMAMVFLWDTK
jgi:hypothetical protein